MGQVLKVTADNGDGTWTTEWGSAGGTTPTLQQVHDAGNTIISGSNQLSLDATVATVQDADTWSYIGPDGVVSEDFSGDHSALLSHTGW